MAQPILRRVDGIDGRTGGWTPVTRISTRDRAVQWVSDVLRSELAAGRYPDGQLPSEDALIRKFQVSRGIVRQVLALLREQGVIDRVRGAGTFVMQPRALFHEIQESRDLAQDVNANGTRVAIRTTHLERHPATDWVAGMLDLSVGDPVIILETLTTLDGFPFSVRNAFMPYAIFPQLVEDPTIDLNRSPYEIMADLLGEPIGDTELQITAANADPLVAQELNVPVGFALLVSSRVIRSRDRTRALEYSVAHARSDQLMFVTVMRSLGEPGV